MTDGSQPMKGEGTTPMIKPRRPLREYELLLALRGEVERYPSLRAAANHLGVSAPYLCRVLNGVKPIADALALALGYERQQLFVPYEHRD